MRDKIVLKAFERLKAGDEKGVEELNLTDEEISVLEEMLEEIQAQEEANFSGFGGSAKAAALGFVEKASFDFFDEFMGGAEAIFDRKDIPWEQKYKLARDKWRRISDQAWEQNPVSYGAGATVGMVGTGVGAARIGMQGVKAGATLGGIQAFGSTEKDTIQEQLKDTAIGTAVGPAVEKVGVPLVKGGAKILDKMTGGITSDVIEMGANALGAGVKKARQGYQKLGAKIKKISDIQNFKQQKIDNIVKGETELKNIVDTHIDDVSRGQDELVESMDNYLASKNQVAFSPDEFSSLIKGALTNLRREKAWTKTTQKEKEKLLDFISDFKERVLFGDEKTKKAYYEFLAKAESAAEGTKAKEWFRNKLEKLENTVETKKDKLLSHQKESWKINKGLDDLIEDELREFESDMIAISKGDPKAILTQFKDLMNRPSKAQAKIISKEAEDNFEKQLNLRIDDEYASRYDEISDMYVDRLAKELEKSDEYEYLAEQLKKPKTFKDALNIKRQLQDEIYTGSEINLKGPQGEFKGTIESPLQGVRNKNFKKILVDLDVQFREKLDAKADKVVKKLGRPDKWKEYRDELHHSLSLKNNLPTYSDKKQLVDDILSNRSTEVNSILKNEPQSSLQQKIQDHWQTMAPEYEDYSKIRSFVSKEGEIPFRKQAQFNWGSWKDQNLPQNVTRRIGTDLFNEYMETPNVLNSQDPQANYVVPRSIKEISHLPLMALGINDAMASEELMHSFETADDVSLERGLGELAPMLEGLYAPSPVQTSKGRARSAIITRSGVEARIVDPMERKVIREDLYNDPTMSVLDKAKKAHKLNITEKIDLDIDLPNQGRQDQQIYAPQQNIEMAPLDIYANLNEIGRQR